MIFQLFVPITLLILMRFTDIFIVHLHMSKKNTTFAPKYTITKENMEKVISGIRPTGNLHLGNYFGA